MAKISNLTVLRSALHVADVIEAYVASFCGGGGLLLRPALTYREGKYTTNRDKGHASIRMIVKSFDWQRGRSDEIIAELTKFDQMLEECNEDISEVILTQFANAWYDFNSDCMAKTNGLVSFFRESLPAAIYWHMQCMDNNKLINKLMAEDDFED